MNPCCYTKTLQYKPQSNPYNSHLYQRNGWMPPNPFNQSLYVLEHYRPNPLAYCCGNTAPRTGGCCGR